MLFCPCVIIYNSLFTYAVNSYFICFFMKSQQATDVMKRGEFLRTLGLNSSALMAFYCMGTLSSCSKGSDPQPAPTTGTAAGATGLTGNAVPSQGKVNFTLDLTSTPYKTLKTEGGFATPGDIIVANAKGGKFIAVSKVCTHQGTTIEYRLGEDNFYCPNHGSRYNDDGTVKNGPSSTALKVYKATLSADGNSLVVTE